MIKVFVSSTYTELLPYRTKIDLAYLQDPSLAATLSLIWQTVAYVLSRAVAKAVSRSRRRPASAAV